MALKQIKYKNYGLAVEILSKIEVYNPNYCEIYLKRGEIYFRYLKDMKKAEYYSRIAIEKAPKKYGPHFMMAEIYF